MIKINKKYLKKIIKEETKKIVEGWDDEGSYTDERGLDVSDAEFEEPPAWRDADELTTTTFEVIAPVINGFLESKDCVEQKDLNGLYIELEKALHDRSMGLVGGKPAPADDDDYVEDDQGEGEHLEMDRYIADHGPLDKDEDLMQEEDKDWMQKAFSKKKGSLHHLLGVNPDKDIPIEKMRDALCQGGKIEQKARAAVNANQKKYASIKDACVEKKKEDK